MKNSKLELWWVHFKLWWIGDDELEDNGKMIPCKRCGEEFFSRCHGKGVGYSYDMRCKQCDGK